ncbi:Geranylgeranyl transferase type-2 subunit alpha [Schizosaccharomyces pombe]
MHGILRVKLSEEQRKLKAEKERAKIEEYRGLVSRFQEARKRKDYSEGNLKLTTELLDWNPETYSVWNYRREILLNDVFPKISLNEKQDLLDNELKYVLSKMKVFPKVYWIFNHRRWCLENAPYPNWNYEMMITEKLLSADARNFHGWHYRRYVVSQIERAGNCSLAKKEMEYTTSAIATNFSNFSALHNRTKLIETILNLEVDPNSRKALAKQILEQDLDMIHQAVFTDPDDSSVWIYHRWLMGHCNPNSMTPLISMITIEERIQYLQKEIELIQELHEMEPENRWCCESLVNYEALCKTLEKQKPTEADIKRWTLLVDKMIKVDPQRRGRYRTLQEKINNLNK